MAIKWHFNPSTGELWYPNGDPATTLTRDDPTKDDAKQWALSIVSDVGLANLSD
jgi:hypothetical protein